MTIGAWIFLGFVLLQGLAISAFLIYGYGQEKEKWMLVTTGVVLVVTAVICGSFYWYRTTSESGKRALKDQQSNLSGGIERSVRVYDINGNLIEEYNGKFDVSYASNHIKFDDETGRRHIIYYSTGMVIIDEK